MRRFVVAGAGIGGLSAALALARGSSAVTVLERRPALAEFGAGIQLAPNATRILAAFGLLEPLRAIATEPETVHIRRDRDAAVLASLPLGGHAAARYGAPFLLVHRPALQRVLAEAAITAGVDLRFGCDVDDVMPDGAGIRIEENDTAGQPDGFIDARGWRPGPGDVSRRTAWRALLPADRVEAAERLPRSNLWLGRAAHLVHYPIAAGRLVNVVAITEEQGRAPLAAEDPWSRPGDPDELRRAFAGWHGEAMRLLDPKADWRRWPLFEAVGPGAWSAGARTRVGDAAHPMLPFLAQGASQAIEDAAALAEAVRHHADTAFAFASYERQRRPRATRVQAVSRQQGDIYHLGRPASDARDLAMRVLGGVGSLARLDWLYGRA